VSGFLLLFGWLMNGVLAEEITRAEAHPHFQSFLAQGVPEAALRPPLEFLISHFGQRLNLPTGGRPHQGQVRNQKTLLVVDYSRPSNERRLFVLNLEQGTVEKHYVSHGLGSGGLQAYRFSNRRNSRQSSLGLFLTGPQYIGKFGHSLKLYGLDPSNSRTFERVIVMHGAHYASELFLQHYGYLGRSHGCLAIEKSLAPQLFPQLQNGTLIYAYHQELSALTSISPEDQILLKQNPPDDNPPPTPEERDQTNRNPFVSRVSFVTPLFLKNDLL